MNGKNEVNVLTSDDLDLYIKSDIHTDDIMDDLHHDRNDEDFHIMTDYVPISDSGDFYFEFE